MSYPNERYIVLNEREDGKVTVQVSEKDLSESFEQCAHGPKSRLTLVKLEFGPDQISVKSLAKMLPVKKMSNKAEIRLGKEKNE